MNEVVHRKNFIHRLEPSVQHKKQKKARPAIAPFVSKSLGVRYAEVLKLREAVARTQSHLKSIQRDRVLRAK